MINSLLHIAALSAPRTELLYQGADARQLWKAPGKVPLPKKRRSGVCKLEMMRAALRLAGVDVDRVGGNVHGKGAISSGSAVAREERGQVGTADMTRTLAGIGLDNIARPHEAPTTPRLTYRQLKHNVFSIDPPNRNADASQLTDAALQRSQSEYQSSKAVLRGRPGPPGIAPGFERCELLSVTGHGGAESKADETGETDEMEDPAAGRGTPPFVGWVATGEEWEAFDVTGVQA